MEQVFDQEIHEFAVYSKKLRLVKNLVACLILALFGTGVFLLFLFPFLFLVRSSAFTQPSPGPSQIALQIFGALISLLMLSLALVGLFAAISASSFALFTLRRLVSHKPTLLITQQGIDFRDLPITGNTFFSWSEIASLSAFPVDQQPITYLSLNPKNRAQFLSHFHPLLRFFVRRGSVTGTLINVPQWFLSEPVEEVLLRIQKNFYEQLRTNEVQIRGIHSTRAQLEMIARQWIEAGWQNGDAAAVYAMYTPDFVDISSPTGQLGTRTDNINGIIALYAAFPDFHATIDDLVLDTDAEKVALRWTATGTHLGTFLNAEPTGKQIIFHGIETLRISNRHIVERAGEWDEGNILRQLGVLPEEQDEG